MLQSSLSSRNKKSVLFICTGNSARSQMAEALLHAKAGDFFDVYSAGTHPEIINQRTLTALTEFGLSTDKLTSKNINDFTNKNFDYVITLCDKANQECRSYPGASKQLAWDFPDPQTRSGNHPFTTTLIELNNRISMFVLIEEKQSVLSSGTSMTQVARTSKTHVLHENTDTIQLDTIAFYKCFTDDIRLKCLMLLQYHGELCVCELMTALSEQSQPKVSRNLALLKKSQLLTTRKHGQWVFYQLNSKLPQWAKIVLAQTTENNISFIEDNVHTLAQMNNRPDKASFCN